MIFPDLAEYEESDSNLAKDTIATRNREIRQLKDELLQLKKQKEKLKKWLEQIQDYHIEMRSSADNQFNECLEAECINVLQDVINKIKDLENSKNGK